MTGRIVLAIALLLTLPAVAAAQAPAAPPPPPPKLEGTAELAFVGTTGNASTNTLSVGGELIARPDRWVLITRANSVRNKSEGELTAESLLFGFRAERTITTRLSAFGEYAYFRDEFAGVDQRNAVMGGLAIKLVDTAVHTLVADAGLGYLNEQRLTGDDVSLTARLTDLLSLKVSNTIRYLHFPPPGFKTTDTTTSIALVAKFRRQ